MTAEDTSSSGGSFSREVFDKGGDRVNTIVPLPLRTIVITLLIDCRGAQTVFHLIFTRQNTQNKMDHLESGYIGLERALMVNAKTLDR